MTVDLAVRNLVIEYSSGGYPVRPIDNLDLDAAAGQLVLLLGASGCGKTTLLSVLAAILKPTSGSVKIGDIGSPSCAVARSRNTGGTRSASCSRPSTSFPR